MSRLVKYALFILTLVLVGNLLIGGLGDNRQNRSFVVAESAEEFNSDVIDSDPNTFPSLGASTTLNSGLSGEIAVIVMFLFIFIFFFFIVAKIFKKSGKSPKKPTLEVKPYRGSKFKADGDHLTLHKHTDPKGANKVKIVNRLSGVVKNISNRYYSYVEIKAKYCDENDIVRETGIDTLEHFEPGDTYHFEIDKVNNKPFSYYLDKVEFDIYGYETTEEYRIKSR